METFPAFSPIRCNLLFSNRMLAFCPISSGGAEGMRQSGTSLPDAIHADFKLRSEKVIPEWQQVR